MANTTLLYPRGYTRTLDETGEVVLNPGRYPRAIAKSEGDRLAISLRSGYIATNHVKPSWEFINTIIEAMGSLFGNFWVWVEQQLVSNDYIYDLSKDFLIDTVGYILTGHRRLNVIHWRDLLYDYPDVRPGVATKERLAELKSIIGKNASNDYIAMWCSHDGGLEDMVMTAYVILGPSKLSIR